jgi:hypothetical protein
MLLQLVLPHTAKTDRWLLFRNWSGLNSKGDTKCPNIKN